MNEQLLIKNIAEIGKLLLKNGAEIYRVEESLERMCQSYGFQDIGVFCSSYLFYNECYFSRWNKYFSY